MLGYRQKYEHMAEAGMINYNKLMKKLKERGITTYTLRQNYWISQGTYQKMQTCSAEDMETIYKKLQEYRDLHEGKEFMRHVSTGTIEDICQLLQCQPQDILDWEVELKPELSYENRTKYTRGF